MKAPQKLIPGDLISIVAPAKNIDSNLVNNAKELFEKRGYNVEISNHW